VTKILGGDSHSLFTLIEYKNFLSSSFLDTQNLVKWIIVVTQHTCDSLYILHVDITAHQAYILIFICSPTILPISISAQHVHVLFIAQHIHILFITHSIKICLVIPKGGCYQYSKFQDLRKQVPMVHLHSCINLGSRTTCYFQSIKPRFNDNANIINVVFCKCRNFSWGRAKFLDVVIFIRVLEGLNKVTWNLWRILGEICKRTLQNWD